MALETKWLLPKFRSCSCPMTGVWRAVAYCSGCAVIYHSPRGCVHVAETMDTGSLYRTIGDGCREKIEPVPLVSTDMGEEDGIFGGIDRLHACIENTVRQYHPECLLIASSCAAGVIGDDVCAEAESAEKRYHIPVIAEDFGGFLGGEYYDGYFAVAEEMIRRFAEPRKKEEGSVLLLGDFGGPWGQYAAEGSRLLSRFGLHVKWQYPGYVPFGQLKEISSASLAVVLGGRGKTEMRLKKLADQFGKDFYLPVVSDVYPLGWENTKRWIRTAAAFAGQESQAGQVIAEEEKKIEECIRRFSHIVSGKRVVIGIGRPLDWFDPEDMIRKLKRMDMKIEAIVFFDNLDKKNDAAMRSRIEAIGSIPILNMQTGQDAMENADMILTTHEITNISTRQLFVPVLPVAGATGETAFMTAVYQLLCRYGNKGGIAYV